ncbi:hypothetical protein BH23ACT2_BH23ACT2_26210 [soil metagenome]
MSTTIGTTTPDQVADRAAAAVLAIPAPIARRLLEVADYAVSIRSQVEEILAQFEELGQVLELPDADAQDPDYDVQDAWWDFTGHALVCRVLQELPVLLSRQGFDGGEVEPAEVRADQWRRVKDGPLATAAGPAMGGALRLTGDDVWFKEEERFELAGRFRDRDGLEAHLDPDVPASARQKPVSPGRRPARPGEVCTCGDPAVVVYETARFGDVGHCGVEHRGSFK